MAKQGRRCRNLVLVPCPFQGHINPMLQLGTLLHSRGFPITIAHAQFNSPQTSNHPEFFFQSLPDGISSKPDMPREFLVFLSSLNFNCRAPFQEFLSQMIEIQKQQDQQPCIIYDALMYFAETVASHLKLPSIILQTGSVASILTYFAYPRLRGEGYIPPQDCDSTELVPGLHPLRFKDLPSNTFDDLDDTLQLIDTLSNIGSSSAIIWNTVDYLEQSSLVQYQQKFRVPNFSIGPMNKIASASSSSLPEEDSSCISWLDKRGPNSVIYVSFGSIASVDAKALTEMAWGLANSKQPFLWVLRPDTVHGAEPIDWWLPEDFRETVGERGCIVNWAPQQEVLAHGAVGGFWSHCGWNSTIESISEGVPMICRPCFGDQKVNTRYIGHIWRTGFELENDLERGKIERAIKRLMVEKEGEEMRQKAAELKEKTEISIKKGGSSYNSLNKLVEHIMSV
ncbi:UDP-glucose iridoid glucosyltransferase-like [Mangifera indica]|uniref:UDP-glucose iridoid glucosyltransferase-like n=1 Tax=Mangifera indica TaxID=29780 RepID=UPI001CF9F911|nr:UDP-glucose iridoid glucosyltransferase-like [Mangifera indica]